MACATDNPNVPLKMTETGSKSRHRLCALPASWTWQKLLWLSYNIPGYIAATNKYNKNPVDESWSDSHLFRKSKRGSNVEIKQTVAWSTLFFKQGVINLTNICCAFKGGTLNRSVTQLQVGFRLVSSLYELVNE